MIDQRVSQGIKSKFFNKDALTTTIPAQFVKKFNCKIVPIFIERNNVENFNLEIMNPLTFDNQETIEDITLKLNQILEKMIIKKPISMDMVTQSMEIDYFFSLLIAASL